MATIHRSSSRGFGSRFIGLIFAIFLGCVLVAIALPETATSLATEWDQAWLGDVATRLALLTTGLPEFTLLLEWIGLALAGYLGALLLLALRHRQPGLFGWGSAAFALAAVSLHVFAWIGFVAYHVALFGIMIFGFVEDLLRWILTPIQEFVAFLVHTFSGGLGWLALATVVGVGVWLTARFGLAFLRGLGLTVGVIVVLVGFFLGGAFMFGLIPSSFWETVLTVFVVVVLWLFWLLVLATVGQLFLDQLRGTMKAGSGQRGVIMGAISVGSALSLLMLIGNAYGAYDFYPPSMATWAEATMGGAAASRPDAAISLVVIGLSGFAVLTGLIRLRAAPADRTLGRSLVYAIVGGLVTTAMSASGRTDGS